MASTVTVFFEPGDVLLFGDHRPFRLGQHFFTRSRFPAAGALLGCIQTALMRQLRPHYFETERDITPEKVRAVLGWEGGHFFRLFGPVLAQVNGSTIEPLLEPPLDLSGLDDPNADLGGKPAWAQVLRDDPLTPRHHNFRVDALMHQPPRRVRQGKPVKGERPMLLTRKGIEWALRREDPDALRFDAASDSWSWGEDVIAISRDTVIKRELRTGIARSRERLAVEDKAFYMVEYLRMAQGVGLAVQVETTRPDQVMRLAHETHTLRLGGKGHRVALRCVEGPLLPTIAFEEGQKLRQWLISPARAGFVTPADPVSWITRPRSTPDGGFDMARRRPKPLTATCAEGSVFYYDCAATGAQLAPSLNAPKDAIAGYGTVLHGIWND